MSHRRLYTEKACGISINYGKTGVEFQRGWASVLTRYDFRVVLVSEDESKAMAWNLKKSFTLQLKQRHKQEAKGEGKEKKASILQVQQRQREEVESEREAKSAINIQLKVRKKEEAEIERKERKKEDTRKKREAKRAMNPSASVLLGHPERDWKR